VLRCQKSRLRNPHSFDGLKQKTQRSQQGEVVSLSTGAKDPAKKAAIASYTPLQK